MKTIDNFPDNFMEFVKIESGLYIIGSEETYSLPKQTLQIDAFEIGRAPVTNAQFQQFVDAGGYHDDQWWDREGLELRNKNKWEVPLSFTDDAFSRPRQPVVGVSFFEAMAFCRWLTAIYKNAGQDVEITLPTEQQWEAAARGHDGNTYPWGNEPPTPQHANYYETRIGATSDVGSFPLGNTPTGLVDMFGNVWVWTSSQYEQK